VPAPPPEYEIRRLAPGDVPGAVASASRAFHDDPLFNFFEPNLVKQSKRLPGLMKATIVDTLPLSETYAAYVDGKAKAVAAWMPPGSYPRSPRREAMFYVRALPSMVLVGRRLPPALQLLTTIDKAHPKHEHWYLSLLAVDPELQGKGVGGALLAPVLERADREGLPVYLETQKEANVAWYGRHGFGVLETLRLPNVPDSPTMWTLQREHREP
jgi:GNAT superfamily N-acetyltransferase